MRALMLALCLLVPLSVQARQGPADQARAAADLLESAGEELEAAGCNIPYPQRDVHLYSHDADSD